ELGTLIGPGTAPTVRPKSWAWFAVLSAPDRYRASITIEVDDNAAIRRLRFRNRYRFGRIPGGMSVTNNPSTPIWRKSSTLTAGYRRRSEERRVGIETRSR